MFLKDRVKYLSVLFSFICFSAFAQLAPRDAVYYESSGGFLNPEFIERGHGWEVSGCAAGLSYSSTIPFAERFASVTCVAETLLIRQCTSKFSDLSGSYLAAYSNVKVDASSSDVYWKVTDGTNDIYSKTLMQDDSWHAVQAPPFFAGDTENCIEIESEASFTGTVYLTKLNIKQDFQMSVMGSLNDTDTDFIPYTPTLTGFGTATGVDFSYKRVGDSIIIRGSFVCGTPTAVEAQVGLPSGLAIKTGYLKTSVGSYFLEATSSGKGGSLIATGEDTYLNMGGANTFNSTSINALAISNANAVCTSSNRIPFTTTQIPIEGWQTGRVNAISQRREKTIEEENVFGAYIPTNGVVAREGFDWINGNCAKSGGSSSTTTCTFTSGLFTAAPVCEVTTISANRNAHITSVSTTTIVVRTEGSSSPNDFNVAFHLVCLRGEDWVKTARVDGLFKQTQIEKDEDVYSATEREWGLWNGEQLYRKCLSGSSVADGTVISAGATKLIKQEGHCFFGTTQNQIPFHNGTNKCQLILTAANGLELDVDTPYDIEICSEYTK